MSSEKDLQALKTRAKDVEGRLCFLLKRIGELEHGPKLLTYRATVDPERCIICGICRECCPTGAISIDRIARVDPVKCSGCGRCVEACPQGAMRLRPVKRTSCKNARVAA